MAKLKITDLLEAGVHFGHQTKRWNPKMKPYIFGTRNGITVFDLTKTMRLLADACEFLKTKTAEGGTVLFVGSKRQAQEIVRKAAEETGMFHMTDRWLGGTLTNHKVVMTRVKRMQELQTMFEDETSIKLPKKEIAGLKKEMEKLQKVLAGIAGMNKLPSVMVVFDVGHEHIAVREAIRLGIPVVGLVDSNGNPDGIEYVIPGNDDALRSLTMIADICVQAIKESQQATQRGDDAPAAATKDEDAE